MTEQPRYEEGKSYSLFSFNYLNKEFIVAIENIEHHKDGTRLDFLIYDESKNLQARIHGSLNKRGDSFTSFSERNISRDLEPNKIVPGLVRESITQILKNNVVEAWKSALNFTEGGKIEYDRLSQDSNLISSEEPDDSGKKRIVLRLRKRE